MKHGRVNLSLTKKGTILVTREVEINGKFFPVDRFTTTNLTQIPKNRMWGWSLDFFKFILNSQIKEIYEVTSDSCMP